MDVTAHMMVRNEEYFIVPILRSVLQAGFKGIVIVDCASYDKTWELLQEASGLPGVRLKRYSTMTPEQNGEVRNEMMRLTKTPWCMMVDGDEYYWPRTLRRLLELEMPLGKRFGYTTLLNVERNSQGYYISSKHSKQAFYNADTKWTGAYPFENPDDILNNEVRHYFDHNISPPHGVHLHCLIRSPYNKQTPWRETLRQTEHWKGTVVTRLRYLPVPPRGLA